MSEQERSENISRLKEILSQLSPNQLDYVTVRPFVQYDKEAAEKIGVVAETVYRWPEKPLIDEAVKLMKLDGIFVAHEILRRNLPKAAKEVVDQLDHKVVNIRYRAALAIFGLAGADAPQRLELTGRDGGPIETKDASGITDEERVARIAAILDAARERGARQAD